MRHDVVFYKPARPLLDPMDFFNSWFDRPFLQEASAGIFRPACDVEESGSHYLFSLDLPGVSRDEVQIEVLDNQLKISGRRHWQKNKSQDEVRINERAYGKFERAFELPAQVDPDSIEASFDNGVLRVAVPKIPAAQPKMIKIQNGKSGLIEKLLHRDSEAAV